jgi:hypothetical protein
LSEAVESILHQSFRDFEFIIIHDARAMLQIQSFILTTSSHPQMRVYHQENSGLIGSLNVIVSFPGCATWRALNEK